MQRLVVAAIVPALAYGAGMAAAAPFHVVGLEPLPHDLPAKCAALATPPASAKIAGPVLAAHVSAANCLAEITIARTDATPDEGSITRLGNAMAPAIAILDNVISVGDPYWRMVALDAKRDLYVGMVVRERDSESTAIEGDVAARGRIEVAVAPWLADASDALVAMADLARQHPQLAKRDQVVSGVIARIPEERSASASATASRLP